VSEVLAFLGVAVLVIVTPGPDTAMTIRGTLLCGRRAGLLTACGVVTGQACWTVAASAGVTALLVASEPAFLALKLAGAAYLVYLGANALLAAIRGTVHDVKATGTVHARTAYRQGLVSDLGNPKMAAFFTSLLPQFGTTFGTMLAFGLLFCVLTWLWLALYATAIAKLRLGRIYRVIQAVTGAVLIALGVRLAAEGGKR
jgi:threonine/homoserine/homoserine lactone efflux protein